MVGFEAHWQPSVTLKCEGFGSGDEFGGGIALDSAGNGFVTVATLSTNFPTANPFQPAYAGFRDAFIAKIDSAGSSLLYSTYLGGTSRALSS